MLTQRVQSHRLKPVPSILASLLCLVLAGCGCDEEDPTIAVVNSTAGTVVVSVDMGDGTRLDFGEVEGGVTTGGRVVPAGSTSLTLTWGDIPVPYSTDFQAEYCYDYEIRFEGDAARVVPIER